ncbi:MAG: hypothetical protein AAB305_04815 [Candidatus Zixiibacteriota bacterium]
MKRLLIAAAIFVGLFCAGSLLAADRAPVAATWAEAQALSAKTNRPIIIDFYADW